MKQETRAYWKALTNIALALTGAVILVMAVPKLLSFFAPFVAAWIIALIASPMVEFLEKKLKIKRKAGTACVIVAVIGLIVLIGYGIAAFLFDQIQGLVADLPEIWKGLQLQIKEIGRTSSKFFESLPGDMQEEWTYLFDNVEVFLGEQIGKLGSPSMSWLGNAAKQLPNVFVGVIMCFVSAFAFTAERASMRNFAQDYMPEGMRKYWDMIRVSLSSAVGGYLKAQLKIEFWIYLIVAAGLLILRVDYAPVLALFIAVLDFLPVFGTGTALCPWIVFDVLNGDYRRALGLSIVWGVSQIVRQAIQPKIMGDSMGLHTLPTVILLYIGYKASGIFGMIVAVPIGIIFVNMYQAGVFDTLVNSARILAAGLGRFRHLTKEDIRLAYHESGEEPAFIRQEQKK